MKRWRQNVRNRWRQAKGAARSVVESAEFWTGFTGLVGWVLVTWGVVGLVRTAWEPAVWRLSFGVLFLGLGGWRLWLTVLTVGLYSLSRKDSPGGQGSQ